MNEDAYELLTRLSPRAPGACIATLLLELGWSGDRFAAAVDGIRRLRIGVRKNETRELIRISASSWPEAKLLAERYYDLAYGSDVI